MSVSVPFDIGRGKEVTGAEGAGEAIALKKADLYGSSTTGAEEAIGAEDAVALKKAVLDWSATPEETTADDENLFGGRSYAGTLNAARMSSALRLFRLTSPPSSLKTFSRWCSSIFSQNRLFHLDI